MSPQVCFLACSIPKFVLGNATLKTTAVNPQFLCNPRTVPKRLDSNTQFYTTQPRRIQTSSDLDCISLQILPK